MSVCLLQRGGYVTCFLIRTLKIFFKILKHQKGKSGVEYPNLCSHHCSDNNSHVLEKYWLFAPLSPIRQKVNQYFQSALIVAERECANRIWRCLFPYWTSSKRGAVENPMRLAGHGVRARQADQFGISLKQYVHSSSVAAVTPNQVVLFLLRSVHYSYLYYSCTKHREIISFDTLYK